MDGRLDEEAWARAVPITDFTQREPVEGGVPSERTEIRVVYDEDALYIGAMLYDDPEGILAFQKRRDGFLSVDDRFMWMLDTFHDLRTGYYFETTATGVMGDGLITGGGGGGGGGGRAWDGIWQIQTEILPDGWSIEIQIPFRTLNFDPTSDTWGINFQRTIRRKNEEILWRGYRRNQNHRDPVNGGRLVGLQGMSQGIGLEAVPYAVTNWKNVPTEPDPTTYPSDIGLDVNYNVTASLRAGVSVNTDFAEAEVDQRRLNLTRFPLRFPEQRDFFLEGSGVFTFAPSSGVEPYFSRRIGLLEGEQIPLNYAARLGGQTGRYELGFIHVNTAELESADVDLGTFAGEQFTVARVKRSILEQSAIGAIYTHRSTGVDPLDPTARAPKDRHTVGADLNYATSRLFGDKNFDFQAFALWNSNPDRGIDRSTSDLSARGVRANYPNDIWSGHISYREFGEDYDPAVGFVTRTGFRRVEPRIGWGPRPDIDWIRRFNFSAQFRNLESITTRHRRRTTMAIRGFRDRLRESRQHGRQPAATVRVPRSAVRDQRRHLYRGGDLQELGVEPFGSNRGPPSHLWKRPVPPRWLLERRSDPVVGPAGRSTVTGDSPLCPGREQRCRATSGIVRGKTLSPGRRMEHYPAGKPHRQCPVRRHLRGGGPLHAGAVDHNAGERSLSRLHAELAELG